MILSDALSIQAAQAADLWGGAPDLRPIVNRENAVLSGTFPFGQAALRLHRAGYQGQVAIRSELWLCAGLAAAGQPVPRAIAARDGHLVQDAGAGRHASVIAWVEGRPMGAAGVPFAGNRLSQVTMMRDLGAMLAGMHAACDLLELPGWFSRHRWDVDGITGEAPFWNRFWEHPALTADEAALLTRTRAWLADRLQAHAAAGGDFGLIHADVLRENVLMVRGDDGRDHPHLIDFDDCGWGFRAFDLGTVLSQCLDEPHLPHLARALSDGYGAHRPFDRDMVPVMTLARCCTSVGWTMTRLDPGHPVHRSHIARCTGLARQMLDGGADWWG